MLQKLLWIALGGALGTLSRYGLTSATQRWLGPGFPWGTAVVNVIGCFLLSTLCFCHWPMEPWHRCTNRNICRLYRCFYHLFNACLRNRSIPVRFGNADGNGQCGFPGRGRDRCILPRPCRRQNHLNGRGLCGLVRNVILTCKNRPDLLSAHKLSANIKKIEHDHVTYQSRSPSKKSLPLSSTRINAGKSFTVII